MQVRNLFRRDDAVSPVIGVILMVAITVILAAVIAAFVLGLGGGEETTPVASFEFDFEKNASYGYNLGSGCGAGTCLAGDNDEYIGDKLTVTHDGGDEIPSEDLIIRSREAELKYLNESGALKDLGGAVAGEYQPEYTFEQMEAPTAVKSGHSVTVVTNYGDYAAFDASSPYHPQRLLREGAVDIVYEGQDTSTILAEWEGPEA